MCFISAQVFAENERGITHLRQATSGLMPDPGQLARRRLLVQGRDGDGARRALRSNRGRPAMMSLSFELASGDSSSMERAGGLPADRAQNPQSPFSEDIAKCDASSLGSGGQASTDCTLHTPKKTTIAGSNPRAGDGLLARSGPAPSAPPVIMPKTPLEATSEKVRRNF